MFFKRQYTPEIMDDFSITDERIDKALKELNIINRYLGGNSTSSKGIKEIKKNIPDKRKLKIIDIGSGGSNLFNCAIKTEGIIFSSVSVDLNIRACKFIKNEYPENKVVCSNALSTPFKKTSVDIIHVSLFLHHFTEEEIKYLINSFMEIVQYGVVINDLQRSVFALAGIKLLTMLFSRSEFVKNDGPLSVKRGFLRSELMEILTKVNASGYKISWRWAFRWLVIIYK